MPRIRTALLVVLLIAALPVVSLATPPTLDSLPQMTVQLTGLDQSGELIYVGVDIAVLEETNALSSDANDTGKDGKSFRVKEGKVKRIITNRTNITINLGRTSEYKKATRYKLAMRTIYISSGADSGEIIIAGQSNGKDGWVVISGSEFELSYFAPAGKDDSIIKHTEQWEVNRTVYNQSKIAAGIVPQMTEMRPKNTFWSGELLLVEIRTTEVLSPSGIVRVALYDSITGALITNGIDIKTYEKDHATTNGAIYHGKMWDEDMLNKWGNYKPKILTVKVDAIIGGNVVETKYSDIVMDNTDPFYRIKKIY